MKCFLTKTCIVLLGIVFIEKCAISQVNVTIDADSHKFDISEYLTGISTVYFWDADSVYEKENHELARWAKNVGVSTMRFPGGSVVQTWDWENPSGQKTNKAIADPWNPDFNGIYETEDNWMSLDEYLTFVDSSNITPTFGVNFNSGILYNMSDSSVARAVRMVNYVKDRGHGGAFWYIGNEDHMENASEFKKHAEAMKAADPNIKCIWNNNFITASEVQNFLAVAGTSADGVETHRKWPDFGVDGTISDWQSEYGNKPDGRNLRTFANNIRNAAVSVGRPDFLVMNNEYGLASDNNLLDFDRYTASLVVIDQLQEHFIGNWDMACYWSNLTWIGQEMQSLLSRENNHRRNASQYGIELLAMAEGGSMLSHSESGGGTTTYGFAAIQGSDYLLYMLNKANVDQELIIDFQGNGPSDSTYTASLPAMSYSRIVWSGNGVTGKVLIDTPDEFGELVTLTVNAIPPTLPPAGNFYPTDDAYVSQQDPNTNFGIDATLHYKGRADKNHDSYMKFEVSGLTGDIVSATLKLYNLEYPGSDATLYSVGDTTWTESTIKWNNKPNMGSAIQTISNLAANTEYSFDVTDQVTADGTYSFGIKTNDTNGTARRFSSKEGSNSPVLEIVCERDSTFYIENMGSNSRISRNASGTDLEGVINSDISEESKWKLTDAGGGYFYLQNKVGDYKLRAVSNLTQDPSAVELASSSYTGNDAKWQLIQAGSNYYLNNVNYSSRRLNMKNSDSVSLGETNWTGDWVQWKISDTETGMLKSARIIQTQVLNRANTEMVDFLRVIPNPVESKAAVSYVLNSTGSVSIEIYNLQGQVVKVLQNTEQITGEHSAVFDASDLKSGFYLLKMNVVSEGENKQSIRTQKILLK